MPSRFVLQPNGQLALFSTVVDHFTYINLTREEAIKIAQEEMGREAAVAKVERGLKDELLGRSGHYGDGSSRWRDALDSIETVHGKKERDKYEAALTVGVTPPED